MRCSVVAICVVLLASIVVITSGCAAHDSIEETVAQACDVCSEELLNAIDQTIDHAEQGSVASRPSRFHPDEVDALRALRDVLQSGESARSCANRILDTFEIELVTGSKPGNIALAQANATFFTGYFAPEYQAGNTPTGKYQYPLYAAPAGWSREGMWHTRREIEAGNLLSGQEIAWLRDPLEVYLIHVNGSARLRFADGSRRNIGYVTTNNRPYTSLGKLLIDAGYATESEMSMATIRRLHDEHPDVVQELMLENRRYVFFDFLEGPWPVSSTGVQLSPGVSIATDHAYHEPGAILLVDLPLDDHDARKTMFTRFMLNHDTGGAIKGPTRADIFFGVGEEAGSIAGSVNTRGRMHRLRLKRTKEE